MKITKYTLETKKDVNLRFAVVSDLHSRPYKKVLEALKATSPDVILMPGDIVEIAATYMHKRNEKGLTFLEEAAKIAPCYYCYGNHEIFYSHAKFGHRKTPERTLGDAYYQRITDAGVNIVNDSYKKIEIDSETEIYAGGLVCGRDMNPELNMPKPDMKFLNDYKKIKGFKILLCHYPHYYEEYLKDMDFDLILSGHAHGGQWRFFNRGVYAPHQGIFPKFTSGMHDGRFIICRGSANNTFPIPRFFNPCEVIEIQVVKK